MSLSREAMIDLMALADGELEGADLERVERLAAGSDEARRVLAAMRSPVLGAAVAHVSAQREPAADGIADAVMARIAAETSGAGTRGEVVPIGAAREAAAARRGAGRSRVQVLVAGGFAALAVAAAAAVWIQSSSAPLAPMGAAASAGAPTEVEPSVTPATSQSAKALLPEGVFPPSGVEVDEIDSPQHDVHVFEISAGAPSAAAAAGHASSVVIMIEDPAGGGGAHP